MEERKRSIALALIAVLFWSTAGSAFKLSLRYADPFQLLFFASLLSLFIFSAYISFTKGWKSVLNTSVSGIFHSAFLGLLNPFGYYVILLHAYNMIPAQEAVILNYTWPIVLTLLSVPMLGHKLGWKRMIAILLSFFGAVFVITGGKLTNLHFVHPFGSFLAIFSAVLWAFFWIQNVRDRRDELNKLFFNFLFGFLYAASACLILSKISLPDWKGALGMIYIGTFEMGITFLVWLKAIQKTKNTASIANLIFIAPFLSLILIQNLLGETIRSSSLVGLVFIVGGILIQQMIVNRYDE